MIDEIKVLDQGYVKLIDVMGDDDCIADAARVSYQKGTKSVRQNRGLIRYLMKHAHTSPFEMVSFKFQCKMPLFIARQLVRHRTASINEMSARYSQVPDEFYEASPELCTTQSTLNKQGGSDELVADPHEASQKLPKASQAAFDTYNELLATGMRRELARAILPVNMYTEFVWKMDLKNLMHFLRLRLESHAQYEIRVYAEAIAEFVKQACPIAWEAFEEFELNAIKFSASEVSMIKKLLKPVLEKELEEGIPNERNRREFIELTGVEVYKKRISPFRIAKATEGYMR